MPLPYEMKYYNRPKPEDDKPNKERGIMSLKAWKKTTFKGSPSIDNNDGLVAVFELEKDRDSIFDMIDALDYCLGEVEFAIEENNDKIHSPNYMKLKIKRAITEEE